MALQRALKRKSSGTVLVLEHLLNVKQLLLVVEALVALQVRLGVELLVAQSALVLLQVLVELQVGAVEAPLDEPLAAHGAGKGELLLLIGDVRHQRKGYFEDLLA